MKQRIVTAAVGLTIFFAVLALYHTVFLNISVAVIIFLALYEMFHVTGVWENKVLSAVCLLFGCALPFLNVEQTRSWLVCGEAVFALALFGILLVYHESALHQSCNGFCCNQCDRLHDQCSDLAAANERNRADRDLLYTVGFWVGLADRYGRLSFRDHHGKA